MFVVSHIVAGSLIYDALKEERKLVRLGLGLVGCFASHWLLDVTPVYHDMCRPWDSTQWFIGIYNVVFIAWLWWMGCRKNRWWLPPDRLLWGIAAWLIWDAWWLFDAQGGPHRLTTVFNGREHWADPRSFVIEMVWILFAAILSWRNIREHQRVKYSTA